MSGCARKDVLPCKMMRAVAHDVFSPRENMMYSGDAGIFRGLRPAIIKWVRAKPARNVLRSKTHHFLRSGKHHIPKEYIMRRRRASRAVCLRQTAICRSHYSLSIICDYSVFSILKPKKGPRLWLPAAAEGFVLSYVSGSPRVPPIDKTVRDDLIVLPVRYDFFR